jgi:hypothetical protein
MGVKLYTAPDSAITAVDVLEDVTAKVTAAASSQTAAAASATAASGSASTATTQASNASSSASAAAASEANALTYRNAAQTAQTNAETAETNAETAEANAQTAQAAAEAAQSAAETAQTAAETARDAAFVNADVYADIATGLAAVGDGEQFMVVEGDEIVRYEDDSGSEVEVARYPASSALAFAEAGAPVGFDFAVKDDLGRAAIGIEEDGTFRADAARFDEINGKRALDVVRGALDSARYSGGDFAAELVFLNFTGQSLMEGSNGKNMTPAQEFDTVAFPTKSAGTISGATTYFAATAQACQTSGRGEFPGLGAARFIKDLIRDENGITYSGHTYRLLICNNAWSGVTIAQLSKGGAFGYDDAIDGVTQALSLAAGDDESFKCLANFLCQGEQDGVAGTTESVYKAALVQLQSDFETDCQAITDQSEDIPLILSQTCTNQTNSVMQIALAQLAASVENPTKIFMATPLYPFAYYDFQHINSRSSKLFGAYLGLVYKRVVIDGESWSPVRPISAFVQGSIVLLKFYVPVRPLVLDTTLMPEQTNFGFGLVDSGGSPLTVSSVSIVQPDTIKIVADSAVPAGAFATYGFNTMTDRADSFTGGGGNLRDSQGDVLVLRDFVGAPLHNWGVIFKFPL